MRTLALPEAVAQWSLASLREKLVKIGAKVVHHARYAVFQMAEVRVRLNDEGKGRTDGSDIALDGGRVPSAGKTASVAHWFPGTLQNATVPLQGFIRGMSGNMEIIKLNTTLNKVVLSIFMNFVIAFSAIAQTSSVGQSTHGDQASGYKVPTAYHEFVVFGNNAMYMSHYSMFHAIHAYQVIVQASLQKDGQDVGRLIRAESAAHPERSYTVSPAKIESPESRRRDDWILPEYMKAGVKFNADVHWGKRADEFLERNVMVTIEKIVYFKQFDDIKSHNSKLTYLIFGEPGNYFAAHKVSTFPDFDQIVEIDDPGVRVSVDEFVADSVDSVSDRLQKNLDGVLNYSGGKRQIKITVKKEIYFEELEEQP